MSSDAPPAAAPPSAKDYLAASLEVAKLELTLAAQKVKAINDLVEHGIPLAASSEIAASTDGDGDDAAQIKKKKKRVFIDADGNVIKRAMSGYNMYMTELMVRRVMHCILLCCIIFPVLAECEYKAIEQNTKFTFTCFATNNHRKSLARTEKSPASEALLRLGRICQIRKNQTGP